MATTAAVLSVLVNADTRQATAALTKYNAQLAAVNEESKKGIETRLGANYNSTAFKEYQRALEKASLRAKNREAFKAELGANFNSTAFNRYQRAVEKAGVESKTATTHTGTLSGAIEGAGHKAANAAVALTGVSFGAVAIAKSSLEASAKFQQAMLLIHTQAGISERDVKSLTKSVRAMAPSVGFGPQQLSEALFHVASAGVPATKAMHVLTAAAKGARVGNADLEDTTNALVGVLKTAPKDIKGAGDAMSTLTAIVGHGNLRLKDLNSALGTGVLPSAKAFGLGLRDVGGALDVMTARGIPATAAATRLRQTFSLMEAPTHKAIDALKTVGLSSTQLATDMRKPNGLVVAVADLRQHLVDSGDSATKQAQIISAAFGGGRTSSGILTLVQNVNDLRKRTDALGQQKGTSALDAAFKKTQRDAQSNMERLGATFQDVQITIGNALTPLLPTFVKIAKSIAGFVDQMRTGQGAGGQFASAIKSAFDTIKTVVGDVVAVFGGLKNAIEIGLAAFAAYKVFKFGEALKGMFDIIRGNPVSEFFGVVSALVGVFAVLSGRQDSAAASARNVAAAWREARAAANGLRDANLNLLQAQLHHTEAQQAVIAAEKQLSVLRKEGKTHTFEYTQAETNLQQARLDEKQSTNDLSDAEHRQTDARNKSKQATSGAIDEEKKHVTSLQAELTNEHKYGASQQQIYKTQRQLTKAREQLAVDEANTVIGQSSRSNKGLATAYQQGATSIREAMKAGVISVSKGLGMISQLMTKAFQALGFSPKDAAKLASQGFTVSQVNTALGGGGFGSFPGHATGGIVNHPGYFAGEEAPQHPEVIIASNPAYRQRNVALWAQAGGMLGIPGFATGGLVTASQYTSPQTYPGFAELSHNYQAGVNADFSALGNLPRGAKINVAYAGRNVTIPKIDVGAGGPAIPPATIRAVDLNQYAAGLLHFSGLHNVMVQILGGGGSVPGPGGGVGLGVPAPTIPNIKVGGRGLISGVAQGAINAIRNAANKRLAAVAATLAPAAGGGGGGVPGAQGPKGLGTFDGHQVADWIIPILNWARGHGWTGQVTSGYRPGFDPSAPSGSEHALTQWPGGAIDVGGPAAIAEGTNLYDVLKKYPGHPDLLWGGIYITGYTGPGGHDYGHFSGTGHKKGGIHGRLAARGRRFARGGVWPTSPPPREPAGRVGRGGGRVSPVGPSEDRAFQILARRTWERLSRHRALPAWAHRPSVFVQRSGVGGYGPYSRPYTTNRRVHFPWNAVHYALNTNNPYSNWAREAIVHEYAHTMQNANVFRSRTLTEGGAQAWADQWSPYVLSDYHWPGDSSYAGYVNAVIRTKGWPWIDHGQFKRFAHGGINAAPLPYESKLQKKFAGTTAFLEQMWQLAAPYYHRAGAAMPHPTYTQGSDALFVGVDFTGGTRPGHRQLYVPDWIVQGQSGPHGGPGGASLQSRNAALSQLLLHEWTHEFQNKGAFAHIHHPKNVIPMEGAAQAYSLMIAPGIFRQMGIKGPLDHTSYIPDTRWVQKNLGSNFLENTQFGYGPRAFQYSGAFHQGGIVPRDGMALVQRGEAIIPAFKKGGKHKRHGLGTPTSVTPEGASSHPTPAEQKMTALLSWLSHIPSQATGQQVIATGLANQLTVATNAGNVPAQARILVSELTLERKWLAADQAKLRKINKALRNKNLTRKQRGALIQDKLAMLQEIGSVQGDIGSIQTSLGDILTGGGTTGGAGGGDPNQPLIDAMTAQTQAMQALQASLDTQTHYMQSVGEIEKRQAIKALSDMISGQISGQFQSRSTGSAGDGSVARYGSVARA